MKLFTNINKLHTGRGFLEKKGRHVGSDDFGIINKACLVESKGKLIWVGPQTELPEKFKSKTIKKINLQGKNIYPAFIDCHTHSVFAGNRKLEFERRINGESYQQIAQSGGGILSTVKATRTASLKELVEGRDKALQLFLSQGVTTVEIKSGYGLNKETEFKMLKAIKHKSKLRLISTFLGAHAVSPDFSSAQEYLLELTKWLPEIKKQKLAERVDIFIDKGYFESKGAQVFLDKSKSLGFSISVHAEQLNHTGAIQLALKLGAKSVDHVVCADEQDIKDIAKSETTAVLLPMADFYLDIDYPKARKLIDLGARVALSTDYNPGSSPSQNINFLGLLARIQMKMSLPEIFSALTVGAAYVLGLEGELGALANGKSCDFFVSDWEVEDFFYDLAPLNVQSTWALGEKIYST